MAKKTCLPYQGANHAVSPDRSYNSTSCYPSRSRLSEDSIRKHPWKAVDTHSLFAFLILFLLIVRICTPSINAELNIENCMTLCETEKGT